MSNVDNFRRFNADIRRFIDEVVPDKVRDFQRFIAFEALKKLAYGTPADIGRARGNWIVTIGVPVFDAIEIEDPTGEAAIANGSAVLAGLGHFEVVFIQNNLPYIEVLENGGFIPPDPGPSKDKRDGRKGKLLVAKGYSTQAPNGMLKVVFEEITAGLAA